LRSNSVETAYKISLLANNALVRTNFDTKDERLSPLTQDFIFTLPPNFFICDGPNVSFIENCGILRRDPNHFQQLSEIFQSLKAQLN